MLADAVVTSPLFPDMPKSVLQIGLCFGQSLAIWERYLSGLWNAHDFVSKNLFGNSSASSSCTASVSQDANGDSRGHPNVRVVGVDIFPELYLRGGDTFLSGKMYYDKAKISVFRCNSTDIVDVQRLKTKIRDVNGSSRSEHSDERDGLGNTDLGSADFAQFDLIIDDGVHSMSGIERTFNNFFIDFLKPGGYYLIEDAGRFAIENRGKYSRIGESVDVRGASNNGKSRGPVNMHNMHQDHAETVSLGKLTSVLGGHYEYAEPVSPQNTAEGRSSPGTGGQHQLHVGRTGIKSNPIFRRDALLREATKMVHERIQETERKAAATAGTMAAAGGPTHPATTSAHTDLPSGFLTGLPSLQTPEEVALAEQAKKMYRNLIETQLKQLISHRSRHLSDIRSLTIGSKGQLDKRTHPTSNLAEIHSPYYDPVLGRVPRDIGNANNAGSMLPTTVTPASTNGTTRGGVSGTTGGSTPRGSTSRSQFVHTVTPRGWGATNTRWRSFGNDDFVNRLVSYSLNGGQGADRNAKMPAKTRNLEKDLDPLATWIESVSFEGYFIVIRKRA
jgi:hypothetical protein